MKLGIFKRHIFHQLLHHQKSNKYDLSFADFTDQEFQYLTTLYLQHTVELNLSSNQICLKLCIKSSTICWQNLQNLNLNNNLIEAKGVKFLLQIQMKQLNALSLSNNQLDDNSLKYLAKNKWQKVKSANFAFNRISDEGIKILVRYEWKQLKSLFIQRNWIQYKSISILLSDWSNLTIFYSYHEYLKDCEWITQPKEFISLQKIFYQKFGQKCQIQL